MRLENVNHPLPLKVVGLVVQPGNDSGARFVGSVHLGFK
jgi:hypothetical protein